MYFPILRGKQYELILLREQAPLISSHDVWPVIEPVRSDIAPLSRAAKVLKEHDAAFTILTRPTVTVGDPPDRDALVDWLSENFSGSENFAIGITLDQNTTTEEVETARGFRHTLFFHYAQPTLEILEKVVKWQGDVTHLFNEEQCGKLYRRKFPTGANRRVLLRDGFVSRTRNADYPESEHFSDLHATYKEEGMDGFSDYSVIGRKYTESGGPAHAIAIHISYLDKDDDMHICHFLSNRTDTPVDPGGKFFEALTRLREAYSKQRYPILQTNAVDEYLDLFDRKHFPGLGYVKKLSMQHHLELIIKYISP